MSITGANQSYFSIDNAQPTNPTAFIVSIDIKKKKDIEGLISELDTIEESNNYLNLHKLDDDYYEVHICSDDLENERVIYNVPTPQSTIKDIQIYFNSQESIRLGFSFNDGDEKFLPGFYKIQVISVGEID